MAEEVLTIDDETGFKDDIEDLERPLLQQNNVLAETSPFKEWALQARMTVPLSVGLLANMLISAISLSFVGHLGTKELAAASLATTLYNMTAKISLTGLLGALDTYASQAVGARKYDALGTMFKQAVLWLLAHTIPVAVAFACLPALLRRLGQPPELMALLGPYLLALLPGVWVDAFFRPFNRILVAQHVTLPQMWISSAVVVQHVGATWLFVYPLRGGYVGAAYATVWSSFLATALIAAYVRYSGLHQRVWVAHEGFKFQPWRTYARLSYSGFAMRAIESWSLSLCSIAAGWLPNPAPALAAMAVAFSVYGLAQMVFISMMLAVCTRVGNGLGAGSAAMAKLSAGVGMASVPPLAAAMGLVLTVPASQRAVIGLFTRDADPTLLLHTRHLLALLAVLLLFDATQCTLSGIAIAAGKQTRGFAINVAAHWGLALPAALLLGFVAKLGVEGLYLGVVFGPVVQTLCYSVLVWRMDWQREAQIAHQRMLAAAQSTSGAGI